MGGNFSLSSLFVMLIATLHCSAQSGSDIDRQVFDNQLSNYSQYELCFKEAYQRYPLVPQGAIEAVAYVNTRFYHVAESADTSCMGMPRYIGVMGLIFNGKGYFFENGKLISSLSGISEDSLRSSAKAQIFGWACAFDSIAKTQGISGKKLSDYASVFAALSEIPMRKGDNTNAYAMSVHLYGVYSFLQDPIWQQICGFPSVTQVMDEVFTSKTLAVLQSNKVLIYPDGSVQNEAGVQVDNQAYKSLLSSDYSPAIWDPTTCNYSSRSGTAVSAYVLHTVQGSYAGCISWFKNCSAQASTHYVMRSSDGQVTQMVLESNKAWHVRDENPYTIGTEMEGYVDNPAWYTEAVYTSHANLVRDICNSGYGINPLRTFFRDTLDNGTSLDNGVHVLAGSTYCTKIAGHQHYPNNDHTDPGRHWNWDYFFKKLNNSPVVTTYTTATGSFYDSGGLAAAYANDERKVWTIAPTNASSVTMTFSSFDVEDNYDFLYIYDGPTIFSPRIGRYNTLSPGTVTANSGVMTIEFRSDCATTAAGWSANWVSATADVTAPSTVVTTSGTWKTDDFTATITDADNAGGSGIEKGYYQVLENQGTEWRANSSRGFFCDNFDLAIHPEWTSQIGVWSISSGALYQSDSTISNTNIYATLNQTLSNRTLYQFNAMVPGNSKVNKRFGLHFFSDSASLTERGNGYFVFFRLETDKLEFYKVTNNVNSQQLVISNVVTSLNQWYDYKIIHDRITGEIWVYRDDILLGTWTDPSPYSTNGKYISFRTGNSQLKVNELKVFRSRASSVPISVGGLVNDDIRYENPSPSVYGAKIKSICQDVANNLSSIVYYDLNIDFTPPTNVSVVNDGAGADEDISYSSSSLSANWAASADPNSDIASYSIAVGSSLGGTDVLSWTNNGAALSVSLNGLSLLAGNTYYISVKAVNHAGLESGSVSSDGIMIASSTLAGFSMNAVQICEGDSIQFTNTSVGGLSYLWEFAGGSPSTSTLTNPKVQYPAAGIYSITLHAYGMTDTAEVFSPAAIQVRAKATASYEVNDTVLYIPDAMATFTNSSVNAVAYDWDFGDGSTSSDVNPWHLYGDTGFFSVRLTASSMYCGNDTLQQFNQIHVLFPEGIDESGNSQVWLYPNPAGDYVEIARTAKANNANLVEIFNSDGQLVWAGSFENSQEKIVISLAGYSSGLYQVVIYDETIVKLPLIVK